MTRRLLAGLLVLASLLLAAPVSVAAGPVGFGYAHYPADIQQPVEQETDWPFPADHSDWVINPFARCSWDVDDQWQDLAFGRLGAGATLAVDECMVASQNPFWRTVNGDTGWWGSGRVSLGVLVTAPSPDLVVRSCYQPQGRCFTAARTVDGDGYVYRLCTRSSYEPGDPALSVIPGSQGGVGLVQTVTVTVTNPTGRAVRNVGSDVEAVGVAQGGGSGCVPGAPFVEDYPFVWS